MSSPCLCCQSVESKNIGEKNDYAIEVCRNCQTVNAVSRKAAAFDYDEYYSEETLAIPDFVLRRLAEIVAEFAPYRKTDRLLDVGCGAGSLLKAALDAGWQAEGLEVSASSIEFLKENNFKVFHGELKQAAFPENAFDVVTAAEIVEHIPDPQEIFDEAFRIIRPGGLFWATTPHGRGLSGKILGSRWSCVAPPEHLHLFSVKGLKTMLEKAGFNQIEIKAHGVNPYELIEGLKKLVKSENEAQSSPVHEVDRVQTSYDLNESLTATLWGNNVKNLLNGVLNLTKLGDSLKIKAVK